MLRICQKCKNKEKTLTCISYMIDKKRKYEAFCLMCNHNFGLHNSLKELRSYINGYIQGQKDAKN